MKTSGIGGQAVIEGIMMRNKDKYAIAVRKPDKEIELLVKENKLLTDKFKWLKLPERKTTYAERKGLKEISRKEIKL